MKASRPHGTKSSANSILLRTVFVRRVHELVLLGYARMNRSAYSKAQEPVITGDLVNAINSVLSERIEPWMSMFSVHDDPPINDGKRRGKRRRRVDLRLDSGEFIPRARFQFECKRLGRRNTVKIYLGSEGLGCFLRGDYAKDDDQAGLIGYVQSGDLGDWAKRIEKELMKTPDVYAIVPHSKFVAEILRSTSCHNYQSQHLRASVGRAIMIDHVLLSFIDRLTSQFHSMRDKFHFMPETHNDDDVG